MTIDTIESATEAVEALLKRKGSIQTDGKVVARVIEELGYTLSSPLVVAALEQLARDKRIELTKTRGKYDSVVYVADGAAKPPVPNRAKKAGSRPRAITTVTDDEVKQAYDVLYAIAGKDGVIDVPSCADYIREQLTLPKSRAGTINKLLFNIGLRDSVKLGGGKMSHRLIDYPAQATLEEISNLLEEYRAGERRKAAEKAKDGQPEQLELPDTATDVPLELPDEDTATPEETPVEAEIPADGQPDPADRDQPAELSEPPTEPQVNVPLTLAPTNLDGFEAAVLYQLLSLYETTNGADLSLLAKRIRETLPAKVRTGLAHLFVEMVRPD